MPQGDSKVVDSPQNGKHKNLDNVVTKHLSTTFRKPFRTHNLIAFEQLKKALHDHPNTQYILDSGCGTALSSTLLAQKHPKALIIGLDQSAARLAKAPNPLPENVLLLQANCEDIWRLCLDHAIQFDHHYILYPNPWPKSEHLKRRWHGHPVFAAMPKLSKAITLRSNWPTYLEEFAHAITLACGSEGTIHPLTVEIPLTLFEKKYQQSGHELFEYQVTLSKRND